MKKIIVSCCVSILFMSCSDVVLVEDISDKYITVLAPSHGVVLNQTSVSFLWQSLEDAESYHIQIATPDYVNDVQIVTDSPLTGNHFSKELELLHYDWRVRGKDSKYHPLCTAQSFSREYENNHI